MKGTFATLFAIVAIASAHGVHTDDKVNPAEDWALYHMQEEHRTHSLPINI